MTDHYGPNDPETGCALLALTGVLLLVLLVLLAVVLVRW